MIKNTAIGLLAIIIIFGGGYLLLRNNPDATTPTPTTNTVNNTDTKQPVSTEPVTTTPALTLGAPKVQTSQSVSTSISTALVTGTVKPNGVSTTYWFEYGKTNALGSRTSAQQIGSGFYDIYAPAYINNLSADTVYYFRLMANNNFGATYGETYTFKTNNNPAPKVSMPTINTSSASNIQRTSATMNGSVNANGWQTNYWFEYGKETNFGNTTSIKSIEASTSVYPVSDSLPGLEPMTKYYFRLNGQNQFGTVNGKTLSFTTKSR